MNARYKGFSLAIVLAGASMQSFLRDVELKISLSRTMVILRIICLMTAGTGRIRMIQTVHGWLAHILRPARDNTSHMNFQFNDFWLTNIKYLRLRNLEIGYDLPKTLLKRVGTSRVRIYVNATNLFTIDNVSDIEIDPEITSTGGLVYPQQKLLTFGFNVSF